MKRLFFAFFLFISFSSVSYVHGSQEMSKKLSDGLDKVENLIKSGKTEEANKELKNIQSTYGAHSEFALFSDKYNTLKRQLQISTPQPQAQIFHHINIFEIYVAQTNPGKGLKFAGKKLPIDGLIIELDPNKPLREALNEGLRKVSEQYMKLLQDTIDQSITSVEVNTVQFHGGLSGFEVLVSSRHDPSIMDKPLNQLYKLQAKHLTLSVTLK